MISLVQVIVVLDKKRWGVRRFPHVVVPDTIVPAPGRRSDRHRRLFLDGIGGGYAVVRHRRTRNRIDGSGHSGRRSHRFRFPIGERLLLRFRRLVRVAGAAEGRRSFACNRFLRIAVHRTQARTPRTVLGFSFLLFDFLVFLVLLLPALPSLALGIKLVDGGRRCQVLGRRDLYFTFVFNVAGSGRSRRYGEFTFSVT